jgi:hypothetical protein
LTFFFFDGKKEKSHFKVAWPSGKAEDCKSFTPSSNLGAACMNRQKFFEFLRRIYDL